MITIVNDCQGTLPGGFFSKLLVVLDWVHNSIYNKEKVFVDWSCKKNLPYNLWDFFFEQPSLEEDNTNRDIIIDHYRYAQRSEVNINLREIFPNYNKYNGKFVNQANLFFDKDFDSVRNEYNKAWELIKIKEPILNKLSSYDDYFKSKILGVTVRIPLHYTYDIPEGVPLSSKLTPIDYYNKISEEIINEFRINNYEKIFIACDIQYFIDLMISKLGEDKLLYTKYDRVKNLNGDWIEKKLSFKDEYELILMDSLLLSKCSYIMGGSSNIFCGVLFMNNKLKFKVFDTLKDLYGC